MKGNFLVVVFIAGALLTSTCVTQKKGAVPQQFNYTVDLKKEGAGPEKMAGIDSFITLGK